MNGRRRPNCRPWPYTPAVDDLRDGGRLIVGFDLDMTLIDSRVSIGAALRALADETGQPIDVARIVATLGPPIDVALSPWFEGPALARACDRFRALHAPLLHLTTALPGAGAAVDAIHDRGGQVIVVTSKNERHARISMQAVGITPDAVVGGHWGPAKGKALREQGAQAYVGDHVADVAAARAAGVLSVSVASGSCSPDDLRAAGTDVVLPDLLAFPRWLDSECKKDRKKRLQERTLL